MRIGSVEQEEWRVVEEFPAYEVSDAGRVRRRLPGPGARVGHVLKPSRINSGYLVVGLGRAATKTVHSLVATAFHGARPDGMEVNHIDGNKDNNAASNIEWVTRSENKLHAIQLGLMSTPGGMPGESNPNRKIGWADVAEIRRRGELGERVRDIAADYPVSKSMVSLILRGEAWHEGR